MDRDVFDLLRIGFDEYLACRKNNELVPSDEYLSYDFDWIDGLHWQDLGKIMVKDELRELTNIMNHWQGSLQKWRIWNNVIEKYNSNDAWELRLEFLESLAHHCLLQPSAVRDTFTFVATNSMHQIRLASEKGYQDYLEQIGGRP